MWFPLGFDLLHIRPLRLLPLASLDRRLGLRLLDEVLIFMSVCKLNKDVGFGVRTLMV